MAIIKCKMCGGDLNITEGTSVCECEYCGSRQTVPSADNEKKMTLFARANRLRIGNEFDKAAGIYESIISDFPEEAEAYWGLVLCRYGIEYVDDPATGKKVPTCHRSSFDSIMDDPDFDQAQENADSIARKVYREEAKQIEEIRKGIIEVSGREEPYDIFICYKETDENGERTIDSVIAQDVYDALTDKGYRVFFSRISLEDKLGTEYEPYIFAALNSAKLMLVFGTDYEYFNAVWVKNEWSRYLKLMAADKTKHLIPCYRGVDAYDMPKEFTKLQAQDMGKVGAIQDLVRGIGKLFGRGEKSRSDVMVRQVVSGDGKNSNALLIRGLNALEDGAFDEAERFFDQVLNMDAMSAEAYLGLFMADLKIRSRDDARQAFVNGDYRDNRNWKRAVQYAKGELETELQGWKESREDRIRREQEEEVRRQEEAEREAERKKNEAERAEREQREKLLGMIEPLMKKLEEDSFEPDGECLIEIKRLKEEAERAEKEAEVLKKKLEGEQTQAEADELRNEISLKSQQAEAMGIFKKREKEHLLSEITLLKQRLERSRDEIQKQEKRISEKEREATSKRKSISQLESDWRSKQRGFIQETIGVLETFFGYQDEVYFGQYPHSYYETTSPIQWKLIKRERNKALLISVAALDCQIYSDFHTGMAWENSSIRSWLNTTFLPAAFSSTEQKLIQANVIWGDSVSDTETLEDHTVTDKVFLLSAEEAESLFSSNAERQCEATAHARMQGASIFQNYCGWWLRSLNEESKRPQFVSYDGSINRDGTYSTSSHLSVRPAIWIDLETIDALE